MSATANKLCNGLRKIEHTKQEVDTMRVELEEAQTKGNQYYRPCDK